MRLSSALLFCVKISVSSCCAFADSPLWMSPIGDGDKAFKVEMADGAEGEVSFSGEEMEIRKTNRIGAIIVTARKGFP